MPQSVTRFPTATANSGGLGNAWGSPGNVTADDNATATATGAPLAATQTLTASGFNWATIPADASVVGLRFTYETSRSGGTLTHGSTPTGATDAAATTALAVRTIGYGTLASGSSVGGGNTFGGSDLSTAAGGRAARTTINSLGLTLAGAVSGTLGNVTYTADYVSATVQWVVYREVTGGASAAAGAGGSKTVLQRVSGGAAATAIAAGARNTAISKAGGATIATPAGGGARTIILKLGGSAVGAASSGGVRRIIVKRDVGGSMRAEAGGAGRLFSYGLTSVTRDETTGTPIVGVRIDVFRVNPDGSGADFHMGRTYSGAGGVYTLQLPSDPAARYWVRALVPSTPTSASWQGTTDETLQRAEALIQGPPL